MTKAQPTLGTGSPDTFVSSVLSYCGSQTFSNHITLLYWYQINKMIFFEWESACRGHLENVNHGLLSIIS